MRELSSLSVVLTLQSWKRRAKQQLERKRAEATGKKSREKSFEGMLGQEMNSDPSPILGTDADSLNEDRTKEVEQPDEENVLC